MRSSLWPSLFILAAVSSAQYPGSIPPPRDYKQGFDSITEREAKDYLTFLATKCEGRGTGQPGFQKAADYVAAHFKAFGLKPMGDDGTYFQSTTFYRTRTRPGSTLLQIGGKTVATDQDIQMTRAYNLESTAELVLLRAAGANASLGDGDQLKGKIVLLDDPNLGRQLRNDLFLSGAAGVLIIAPKLGAVTWEVSQRPRPENTSASADASITKAAAKRILDTLAPHGGQLLNDPVPDGAVSIHSFAAPVHIASQRESEPVKVPNVVGLIEGSDPTLKAEVVGVGGHLDHLGKQGDVVYPGADDDGSGSTAVLCIAKALSLNPVKPKKSILLMTFFGEEMGLLGSRFLSDHPPVPLQNMVSELQMDMVARDSYGPQNGDPNRVDKLEENFDTMRLVGSKRISTELDQIIQEENKSVGLKFKYDSEDVYTRSDHYNFARHGVPIAFLFDGFTPDYHRPTDTIDKIDFLKLTCAAKLFYLTAMTVANLDHAPVHDVK
jgi:Zn-dependent M28 family amino/carboxypeptidase